MKKLSKNELKAISGGKASKWECFWANLGCSNTWDGLQCKWVQDNCW